MEDITRATMSESGIPAHFSRILTRSFERMEMFTKPYLIDIQAQAGPETFEKIINVISDRVKHMEYVPVPYNIRAWTVQTAD